MMQYFILFSWFHPLYSAYINETELTMFFFNIAQMAFPRKQQEKNIKYEIKWSPLLIGTRNKVYMAWWRSLYGSNTTLNYLLLGKKKS